MGWFQPSLFGNVTWLSRKAKARKLIRVNRETFRTRTAPLGVTYMSQRAARKKIVAARENPLRKVM